MLIRLSVRNLAVVEAADVCFGPGLNVITGETGAGKSVLLGALHLVLGERADRTVVRTGEKEAAVTAVYAFGEEGTGAADAILEEAGLPVCDGGELIIRRTVTAAGQSRVRVNDAPATATVLRALAPLLTEIHGPDDPRALRDSAFQLELTDRFAGTDSERAAYAACWQRLQALKSELRELAGDPEARRAEALRLAEDVAEIEAVAPTEADGEELAARHAEAANAGEILSLGTAAADILTDGEGAVSEELLRCNRTFRELARLLPEAAEWEETLADIQERLQDLSSAVARRLSRIEADPDALERLEARMAQIQRLRRRYGKTVPDILAALEAAKERLAVLGEADSLIAALNRRIAEAEAALGEAAETLSAKRRAALPALSEEILAELRGLGFDRAVLPIRCEACPPGPDGADTVVFCFGPNPGEDPRPLADIASSGEIARVMLAVDAIAARHRAVPTLIFDEIDANIGGETGRAVGRKLRALGERTQILCITHQPQCAVFGHAHFRVAKQVTDGRSVTRIEPLGPDARAAEIARMLGGADLTSVTADHAREMLDNAARSDVSPQSRTP